MGTDTVRTAGWFYIFGPEGARAVLSAIAGSMITVAGLTFSITMLTLQLASSQFGPRMLRDFMRDRGNQLVLGVFISTFLYCLLVLRTVRGTEEASFTPHIAVAFGLVLAVASLAVLIFYVHHVATSIRVETLLAELGRQAREGVDRLYPAGIGEGVADSLDGDLKAEMAGGARWLAAVQGAESGYVQRLDDEGLMSLACRHGLLLRVEARPGAYLAEADTLMQVVRQVRGVIAEDAACPEGVDAGKGLAPDIREALARCVIIGPDRTPHQDIELTLRRMVEIAQRALSPGINDPTTALYCIDRLQEALLRLASRRLPGPHRFDDRGELRIIAAPQGFVELASPALAAVARYALEDADVVCRLLRAVAAIAGAAHGEASADLRALGGEIAQASLATLRLPSDKARVAEAARRLTSRQGRGEGDAGSGG
jgi:uncharacterized membrane protein